MKKKFLFLYSLYTLCSLSLYLWVIEAVNLGVNLVKEEMEVAVEFLNLGTLHVAFLEVLVVVENAVIDGVQQTCLLVGHLLPTLLAPLENLLCSPLNLLKEGIGLLRVEDFVTIHDRNEVLGLGEIDDVVGIAWKHVDALDVVARYFEFDDFVCAELALLNETVTSYHDEELPLGVVPVLALCDAWLADVDAHLSCIEGMNQLRKGTANIHIHLERKSHFFFWEVAEVGAIKLLGKRAGRNLGNKRTSPLLSV